MLTPSEMPKSLYQARLWAVAEYIDANAESFNMGTWDCCIAGMTARYATGHRFDNESAAIARDFLGLDADQTKALFAPDATDLTTGRQMPPRSLHSISAKWAAAVVRYLALVGRVDWPAAREAVWGQHNREAPGPRLVLRLVTPSRRVVCAEPGEFDDTEVIIERVLERA